MSNFFYAIGRNLHVRHFGCGLGLKEGLVPDHKGL